MKNLLISGIVITGITACNSGTNSTTTIYEQPAPTCNFGGSTTPNTVKITNNSSLKVANGCNPTESSLITQLVVGISSTNNPESAQQKTYCTGTPIGDGTWVLTAAHCIVDDENRPESGWSSPNLTNPESIFLWQGANLAKPSTAPVSVSAVYLHSGYTPDALDSNSSGAIPADIALLKVNNTYPLAATLNTNNDLPKYSLLWITGYGNTEYKGMRGILFYRQIYYATNLSPYLAGSPNVGEFYTIGSIPVNNYVWKFSGPGDSGGGDFIYTNNTFYIAGIHSWALLNPGTYGPLPTAYGVDTSVSYYAGWINNIINGTPSNYVVRN